jgi:hypothetical protein
VLLGFVIMVLVFERSAAVAVRFADTTLRRGALRPAPSCGVPCGCWLVIACAMPLVTGFLCCRPASCWRWR